MYSRLLLAIVGLALSTVVATAQHTYSKGVQKACANDYKRHCGRQMDGIAKAKGRGVKFGRRPELTEDKISQIKKLRKAGTTVPEIMSRMRLSKASVYRALGR